MEKVAVRDMRGSRWRSLLTWFDNEAAMVDAGDVPRGIDWPRMVPFVALHLGCLAVIWVGVSAIAVES